MAAKDKNGQAFTEGQKVKVDSAGPTAWSSHDKGKYEGTVIGVHEDGPHVLVKKGKDEFRIAPLASECEIV